MVIERTLDALKDNISCNHRIISYKGDFFHNHDGYELFLLLNGSINYYIERLGMQLQRGDFVLIKPYDFHRREVVQGDSYERIVINIKDSYMKTLSSDKTNVAGCFNKVSSVRLNEQQIAEYTIIAHHLGKELEADNYGSDILVDSYIKQILVMVNRISSNQNNETKNNIMPSLISNTIAYIEENITEEISLNILSDILHHNGTYISRCFKNITGISLQQYIIQKRIALAKKYLFEGYPPKDVCFLSGFNDYSNFSRTFKKQTGMSPKQYQARNLKHVNCEV